MTDINTQILELIKQNASIEDICQKVKITKKQLKRRIESIRYEGINVKKLFAIDGAYRYFIDYSTPGIYQNVINFSKPKSKNFKVMLISDTHIGNSRANLDYIKLIYDYCSKNNINTIFHCGDLLEGKSDQTMGLEEQIDLLIQQYPSDSNILTYVTSGDHDESFIEQLGLDLNKVIENNRGDIIMTGYKETIIQILNEKFTITHTGSTTFQGLRIQGHSHRYKLVIRPGFKNIIINVPTLSDIKHTQDYPGAIEIEFTIENEKFENMALKHITITENNKLVDDTSNIILPFPKTKTRKQKH